MSLVEIKTTNTLNLTKADRPYSPEEEEAEEKAVKFPSSRYKRIKPVFGTLGYLFRNLNGNNYAVIEFLRNAQGTNKSKFIKLVIILWENMDEYSRNRVDIWDWICRKYDIPLRKFHAVVQEGMFDYEEMLVKVSLSGYSSDFIELVKRMAKEKKNIGDRKIMQEVLGLANKEEGVKVDVNVDNSKKQELHIHTNEEIPSFLQDMRETRIVNSLPEKEVKALPESKQEYIDTKIVHNEPERELLEQSISERNFEEIENQLLKEIENL